MRSIRKLALALCLLLAEQAAFVASYSGADPFEFLFLDGGARQAALGGAFAAGNNDANALSYNPAGIGFMQGHHASFMHTRHFQDVTRQHLAVAFERGIGLYADHISYGPIRRTTLSQPEGAGLDEFTPSALVLGMGYEVIGHHHSGNGPEGICREEGPEGACPHRLLQRQPRQLNRGLPHLRLFIFLR